MKVYTIIENQQFDCGEFSTRVIGTYTSEALAREEFRKTIKYWQDYDFGFATTQEDVNDTTTSWSIWEEEEYAYNHVDIILQTSELNGNLDGAEYFSQLAEEQIEQLIENKDDERITNLTEEEKEEVCKYVGRKLMGDDSVWQELDYALSYYIFHNDIVNKG